MHTRDETVVYTRHLGSDIWVNGRAIWVGMSQETLGGCMYTRDETIECTRYLVAGIVGDFGWLNVYASCDYARGMDFGWVDVRATLGPDVALDFGWVFVYCARSGDRILQETLGGFLYTL